MALFVRTGSGGASPDFLIEDLGYVVLTGASWTLLTVHDGYGPVASGQFTANEIKNSVDLYNGLADGYLEWSQDGYSQDTDAFDSDYSFVNDFGNNHFDLTNGRLTIPNRTSGWTPTLAGDFFYDVDDGYLVFFDGYESKFVQLTEGDGLTSHDQLSGLLDDDHTQYLLLAGNGTRNAVTGTINVSGGRLRTPSDADPATNFATPVAGEIAYDSDDGYMVFFDGVSWVQLRDYSDVIDHGTLAGLLDDDHTQYPLMTGNAARNAITGTFDFGDGYLIVPTYGSAPVTSVVDGATVFSGGLLYMYDATRVKWLSVNRAEYWMGRNASNATNLYLRAFDGLASSSVGYRMQRAGTITAVIAQADVSGTWTLEVRRNNSVTAIASLTVTAALGNQVLTTNVDISQGDEIQLYLNGGPIANPSGAIEVAWRL